MLTFLSSPKPFRGKDKENQYRAIRNWLNAVDGAEVILYGDSAGIEEAGLELNVNVIKEVESSSSGVPYFQAITDHAAVHGKYDMQIYLNCDILLSGIFKASNVLKMEKFLFIGQRIDLSEGVIVEEPSASFKKIVYRYFHEKKLKMHESTGIDYFMFRRNMWNGLRPIVIGRAGYDNALLTFCKENQYSIIDGTLSVIALHQFHDYNHVSGNEKFVFGGTDAKHNLIVAGKYSLLSVSDADYILDNYFLLHNPCRGDTLRSIELDLRYIRKWRYVSLGLRAVWRILNWLKIFSKVEYTIDKLIEHSHPIFVDDTSVS